MLLALFELEGVRTPWLWLLLIGGGAGLMFWTYRDIYLRSRKKLTWGLMALRGIGLLALVLALAKPTLTSQNDLVDPGRVAVVLDNSLSMALEGRYARATQAIEKLRAQINSDRSNPPMELELFDVRGKRIDGAPPREPTLERTDLVRGITHAAAQLRSKLLVGVVLISDGMDNTGREDAAELGNSPVPVYAVGYLSDSEASRMDLELRGVQALRRVMANHQAEITVTVAKSGGPAVEAEVVIKRGADAPLAKKKVQLGAGQGEQDVKLTIEPTQTGSFVFTAAVSSAVGETLRANNSRRFPLEVHADAIGVLYLEGFLRYEYKFLKNRLQDDPDIHLVTAVRRANPSRASANLGRVEITSDLLSNLDLVILGDMEGDYLTADEQRTLLKWVESGAVKGDASGKPRRSHSLLVLGGYRSFGPDGFRKTRIADALPVVFEADGARQTEEPFGLQLTPAGEQHAIFKITGDRVQDTRLWKSAPPLLGSSLVQRAKAGADVLAVNPNRKQGDQSAVVIAAGRYGSGQTMVITADTTWRWTRVARVSGKSDTLYARFWSQTVRWLTGRDVDQDRPPLTVSTAQPAYKVGQQVTVRVERQADADGGQQGNVQVDVVDEAGQRVPVQMRTRSAEPHIFLGSFYPAAGGRYEVNATLTREGKAAANQSTEFLVHGSRLELQNTGVNRALLRKIADQTGGVFADVDDVASLTDQIERKERRIHRTVRTEFWNSPLLFLLFLAAVTAEWTLRKRNQLV